MQNIQNSFTLETPLKSVQSEGASLADAFVWCKWNKNGDAIVGG